MCCLPLVDLKSCTHLGYHAVKHAATIMCADHAKWLYQIRRSPHTWPSEWLLPHGVNRGQKETWFPPLKFLGLYSCYIFPTWVWQHGTDIPSRNVSTIMFKPSDAFKCYESMTPFLFGRKYQCAHTLSYTLKKYVHFVSRVKVRDFSRLTAAMFSVFLVL